MGAEGSRSASWIVRGVVVPGERRGRQLGYPTANVAAESPDLPEDGVYAGYVAVADEPGAPRPAAISVGTNPTFAGARRTVEAYLLDWEGDLYGQRVEVHGRHWLRGMTSFASVAELLAAMADDVARARALCGHGRSLDG